MRIGIFSECYEPILNGVTVSINTFKQELEKRGHEYFIFTSNVKDYKDADKKHIFRFPAVVSPWEKNYPIALPFIEEFWMDKISNLNLDIIQTVKFVLIIINQN